MGWTNESFREGMAGRWHKLPYTRCKIPVKLDAEITRATNMTTVQKVMKTLSFPPQELFQKHGDWCNLYLYKEWIVIKWATETDQFEFYFLSFKDRTGKWHILITVLETGVESFFWGQFQCLPLPLQVSFPIFHIVRRKKSFSRKASNVQGSPDAEETQTGVHKNDLFVPILFSTFIFLGTI